MKGNSAVQLKREFSDLYHRETYLKEEYLRVARDSKFDCANCIISFAKMKLYFLHFQLTKVWENIFKNSNIKIN